MLLLHISIGKNVGHKNVSTQVDRCRNAACSRIPYRIKTFSGPIGLTGTYVVSGFSAVISSNDPMHANYVYELESGIACRRDNIFLHIKMR